MNGALVPLDLLNDVRERLDDVKTHSGPPPSGTTYRWEAYDNDLLWRNSELITYLNNAILEIGLRNPVEDDTSGDIVEIELIPGTQQYEYHSCILAIDNISLRSQSYPLHKTTQRAWEKYHNARARVFPMAPGVPESLSYGSPISYYEDSRKRQLVLDVIPAATDHLDLSVRRLFLGQACWDARCQPLPEPGVEYREAILQWMMSRAYGKRNCDAYDNNASARAAQEFARIVGSPVSLDQWNQRRLNANLTMRVGPRPYPGWRRSAYPYRHRW